MSFKEHLKDELLYRGMTSKELSNITGISQGSLSNYLKENSSTPSVDIAVKIASALNVTVEYLVLGKSKESKIKEYPTKIKILADKIEKLSDRDIGLLSSFVDILLNEQNK